MNDNMELLFSEVSYCVRLNISVLYVETQVIKIKRHTCQNDLIALHIYHLHMWKCNIFILCVCVCVSVCSGYNFQMP